MTERWTGLDLPFVFVATDAKASAAWRAAQPGAVGLPARVVVSRRIPFAVGGHRPQHAPTLANWWLLPLGARGPRFMERIPNQSGKEAASDVPSWARGIRRQQGESPTEYAKRLMDDHYGPGGWNPKDTGPRSDFNRIKKFGARGFRDPALWLLESAEMDEEA